MWFGRIGGGLVLGGGVLFAIALATYLNGGGTSGLAPDAALALFAGGALVLAATGPKPLDDRGVRIGLGMLAVGQLSLLALAILTASPTFDPIGNRAFTVLTAVGLWAAFLGSLLTGLALVPTPRLSRAVGSLFLLGMLLLAGLEILGNTLHVPLPPHAILAGLGLAVLGDIGVGVLAIIGSRSGTPASA
jgi:hypothetical protein